MVSDPRSNPPGHLKGPSHETDLAQPGCGCCSDAQWLIHKYGRGRRLVLLRWTVRQLRQLRLSRLRGVQRHHALRRVCSLRRGLLWRMAALSRDVLSPAANRPVFRLLENGSPHAPRDGYDLRPRNEKVRANLVRFARTIVPPGNVPPCWFAVASLRGDR